MSHRKNNCIFSCIQLSNNFIKILFIVHFSSKDNLNFLRCQIEWEIFILTFEKTTVVINKADISISIQ